MDENTAGPSAGQSTENLTGVPETPEMAELEADIARTREELADTVDQLTAKLDVKTRFRNSALEAKDVATLQAQSARQQLLDSNGHPRPAALGVAGGVLAAIAAVILVKLWQRPPRRSSRRRGRRR
jgi:hypothetical protein